LISLRYQKWSSRFFCMVRNCRCMRLMMLMIIIGLFISRSWCLYRKYFSSKLFRKFRSRLQMIVIIGKIFHNNWHFFKIKEIYKPGLNERSKIKKKEILGRSIISTPATVHIAPNIIPNGVFGQ
jgi:hypothetical protein